MGNPAVTMIVSKPEEVVYPDDDAAYVPNAQSVW
jgi:hypothetical protein